MSKYCAVQQRVPVRVTVLSNSTASAVGGAAGFTGISGGRGHSRVAVPPGVALQARLRQFSSVEQGFACRASAASVRSRSPLPKAALGRGASVLLSQCGPTGSVPSSAAARPLPTARSPPAAALAPRPPLLALSSLGARQVRPAPPLRPSLASWLLIPSASAPPGRQVEVASGAAVER